MTADERIEALLNEFGQTISDLPTANDYKLRHDQIPNLIAAMDTAEAWYDPESNEKIAYSMMAYICHLVEIIDRMEWALENARVQRRKTVLCKDCIHWTQTVKAKDSDFALGDCSFHNQHLVMNEGFCAWGVSIDEAEEDPE